METVQIDEEELINVNILNRDINILEWLPYISEVADMTPESRISFKNELLSTLTRLYDMIDFLKRELEEKNLLVRTLLFRDANDVTKIDISLLKNVSSINLIETSSDQTVSILPELSQEDNIFLNDYDSHLSSSILLMNHSLRTLQL